MDTPPISGAPSEKQAADYGFDLAQRERASVLVVDDNHVKRAYLKAVASGMGLSVVAAESGEEALRVLLTQDFALILLDVRMPIMDGYECAQLIHSRPRSAHTPIIFVTAEANSDFDRFKGYTIGGAVDWLYSPIVPEVLQAKIKVFAGLYYLNREVRRQAEQLAQTADVRRRHAEEGRLESESRLSNILGSIDNMVWSMSEAKLLYLNPVAEKIYGRSLDAFFRDRDLMLSAVHRDDYARVAEARARLLVDGGLTHEYRIVRPDGEVRWLEERATVVRDEHGKFLRIDGISVDISARRAYEEHIEYLANHDVLTSLSNRNFLGSRIDDAQSQAHNSDREMALLYLDLDRFKDINDSFGHAFGDELLRAVASRLKLLVPEHGMVAREGGDEFMLLMMDVHERQDVLNAAARIINAFCESFFVGNRELFVTTSIGIAVCPSHGTDLQTLLRNADTAMYQAKREHGNTYQLYSTDMSESIMERTLLEGALRQAIERDEFFLVYQPKLSLATGRITGAEALIRWKQPELGMVSPARFIPLAEATGLILPIGAWVLKTACRQIKAWQDQGLPPIYVSVNISARQFMQADLVETVLDALRQAGVDSRCLELEMTETIVMNGAENFIAKLQALKAHGIRLSIDDFGTGYSSLSYLKRFPLDFLKIDQSFVKEIVVNPSDAAIGRSIISLGHSLNLKVIAEGVETEAQMSYLRRHGCDEMQGYYFSRPVPADEFAHMLAAGTGLTLNEIRLQDATHAILLVDDDANVLKSLSRLLRQDDYEILTASNAMEGFELLAKHRVQVIISDQQMAPMNGVEFLGGVKQTYPDIIRIILSGHADRDAVIAAINTGAVYRFFLKPWDDKEIRANVREAFRQYWLTSKFTRTVGDAAALREEA